MKMNRKNLKLTPIRLMVGAGLIMASFLSEASALPSVKCGWCNQNPKNCADKKGYFEDCRSKCPKENGKDPIEKCTKAHEEATPIKLIKKGEKVKKDVPNVKVDVPCEEVKRLIDTHGKLARETGISDYSWKEIKYLVNNCTTGTVAPGQEGDASSSANKTPPVKFEDDLSAAVKNRQLKPVDKSKVEETSHASKPAPDTPSSELAQVMKKREDQKKLRELLTEEKKTPQEIQEMIKENPGLFHDHKFIEDELKKEEEKHK